MSNLVFYRTARGLSQTALAKLAGVSQPLIWQLEHRSDPKGLRTALAIAAALRVKVTDIWPEAAPVVGTRPPTTRPQHRARQGASSVARVRRGTPKKPR